MMNRWTIRGWGSDNSSFVIHHSSFALPTQGQVYVSGWQKGLVASQLLPRFALLAAAKAAAHLMRRRIRACDRREAKQTPAPARNADGLLYFADIYHGGATFWDWVVLHGGGLWWHVLWPLVVETTVERLRAYPELRAVLELDGHTYEELETTASRAAIDGLRQAIVTGRMEIANGTYAQPLAPTISGEANLRHFFHGLNAIERVLGASVDSFVAGEPQFFPQLPQVLAGFGIRNVVLRTHWAPFGTDPAADADIMRWQGSDGSRIRAVPRYGCMDYTLMKDGHPGVQNAGLTGDDFERWTEERTSQFAAQAAQRGIVRPLITRLADPKPPESPFPRLITAARRPNVRLVTVREYFNLPRQDEPVVSHAINDIPSTIPWGLAGEQLHRQQVRAESALLVAERLDAIVQSMGGPSHQPQLDAGWKLLLRAQHHDLHLCGPWHSTRHGSSMGEVGCEFARQAVQEAAAVRAVALETLAHHFDRRAPRGRRFLLFNPSPWPRHEMIQLPADVGAEVWQGGTQLVTQASRENGCGTVAFLVHLPPLGVDLVELCPAARAASAARAPVTLPLTTDPLADHSPAVRGVYLSVWEDGRLHRSGVEQIEIEEEGPLFRRHRVRGQLLDLSFVQSITAIPALRRIHIATEIDFGSGRHLGPQLSDHRPESAYYIQDERKLCLNFVGATGRSPLHSHLFCDSPFLLVEPSGPRFTAPSFAAFEAKDEGAALLHKGTPGWFVDREEGVLRNVLAWAPEAWLYASDDSVTPGRSRYTAVHGRHRYEHGLAAIVTRLDAVRAAHDFRLPMLVTELSGTEHGATTPWSFLAVAPEQVVLTALFARGGRAYARLWNAGGHSAEACLSAEGVAVSLRLEEEGPSSWPRMRPWGIQTVRLAAPAKA
jgi:hypothetical protein